MTRHVRRLGGILLIGVGALAAGVPAAMAAPLPDGRAYELVNPGSDMLYDLARMPALAEDGNTVGYSSLAGAPGAAKVGTVSYAVARRTTSGWVSEDANLPSVPVSAAVGSNYVPVRFSSDFSQGLYLSAEAQVPEDTDPYETDLWRLTLSSHAVDWLSVDPSNPTAFNSVDVVGASPDVSRAVFAAYSGSVISALYSRDSSGLQLISVYPDGTPAASPYMIGSQVTRYYGEAPDPIAARAAHGGVHAISDDATRVYWEDTNVYFPPFVTAPLMVWDRDHTVIVSASKASGDLGTPHNATFLAASHDGAISYFDSPDQLTDAATPGGGIYRYDLDTDTLELVVPAGDPSGLFPTSSNVSDDMSHIYFFTSLAMTPDAQAGQNNLYVWSAGEGVKYIATVGSSDAVVRASRDGRYAVLQSSDPLRGAPTNGHVSFFVYDDNNGSLACATCRADGSPSQADANLDAQSHIPNDQRWSAPRNITDDGRLFFATKDHLVPKDTGAGIDIYEYDHGKLSLITTGTSDSNAYLQDNTDNGSDVFFMTRTRLLRSDGDSDLLDLYDARVGGGFPEPVASEPCRDDDCQGAPASRPDLPKAGSVTASGPGNATPGPAATAKVARSLRLSRLTAAQRAQLARTGRVSLAVRVTGGGKIVVRARAVVGGRSMTVGAGSRTIRSTRSVVVHVTLRLTSTARRALTRAGRLKLSIDARLSGASSASRTSATLTSAHR